MTVYVDDVEHKFHGMLMCHMWADTLEELFAMADRIGVQRRWIQGHPELSIGKAKNASFLHFDIAKGKKRLAIKAGAILTDQFGPSEFLAKQDIARFDPPKNLGEVDQLTRAHEMLERIARSRGLRAPKEPTGELAL